MELALVFMILGAIGGFVGGYALATHIHSVAAAATSAITRATTVSSGDVAKLNNAVSGLGDAAAKLAAAAQTPAVTAVADAVKAAPQPQP